jgi:hypothetical protein
MPRVIVTTDPDSPTDAVATLDELVLPTNLNDDRDAAALIERLGWAISDAADAEADATPATAQPSASAGQATSVAATRSRRPRSRSRAGARPRSERALIKQVAVLLPRRAA